MGSRKNKMAGSEKKLRAPAGRVMIARGCVTLIVSGPGSCLMDCFPPYPARKIGLKVSEEWIRTD